MKTTVNGLVTEVKGEGKPIILLHGYLSSKESFSYQINYLSKFRRVYAPDLTGFGESKKLSAPYSLNDYVMEVKDFITECKIEKCDILAHSFGGRIAMRLALVDSRIDRLVLTGSAGLKPKRKLSYYIKVYSYKILKRFLPAKLLINFGSSEFRSLDEVMKKSYLKIVNEHQDKEVKKIKNRTLIIYGEHDKETPLYMAKRLNKYIKNSTLKIIKSAGHFAFIDDVFAFNIYLKEFLLGD